MPERRGHFRVLSSTPPMRGGEKPESDGEAAEAGLRELFK